jgi:hypothetical protein
VLKKTKREGKEIKVQHFLNNTVGWKVVSVMSMIAQTVIN